MNVGWCSRCGDSRLKYRTAHEASVVPNQHWNMFFWVSCDTDIHTIFQRRVFLLWITLQVPCSELLCLSHPLRLCPPLHCTSGSQHIWLSPLFLRWRPVTNTERGGCKCCLIVFAFCVLHFCPFCFLKDGASPRLGSSDINLTIRLVLSVFSITCK